MSADFAAPERRIYSVSELTRNIKELLEDTYPFLWITGEISNLRMPPSGHLYFTLKDETAQISAVMFHAQNRNLKFRPEDGMAVIAMGRLNVYEAKGIYQVIAEYMEPRGVGILQIAFEQLKIKLQAEGLFDKKYKHPLPFLPQTIAVVTSPTGAVIRDIMNVLDRRFPNLAIEIMPVKVQGEGAASEIADALELLNERGCADVIVLARGGGSLEDLHAFNSEVVARAIFSSKIPVVSAIGHETDFTIADFTADVRAPTPSAAAEIIVPVKEELSRRIGSTRNALKSKIFQRIQLLRERTEQFSTRLVHSGRRIADYRLRLDDTLARIVRATSRQFHEKKIHLGAVQKRLALSNPDLQIKDLKVSLESRCKNLRSAMQFFVEARKGRLRTSAGRLSSLNPLDILRRGYSVTRTLPDYVIVKDVKQTKVGGRVEVTVSKGAMVCRIERKKRDGQTNI
ncbi:MAG: exodeoxyribonuclease VII large subunit [Deltaproteobacteria bacterium]|nr:exodeoxyribonuclease VII large subunit [Deltaproteobacteria bacterium]